MTMHDLGATHGPDEFPAPMPPTVTSTSAQDVKMTFGLPLSVATPMEKPPPPPAPPTEPPPGDDRLTALEQLVAELAAEITPVIVSGHGTFKERITSRKLWVAVASMLLLVGQWARGNISGAVAPYVVAGIGIAYLVVQGIVDAMAARSTQNSTVVSIHRDSHGTRRAG